jgi:hypothetical protein
MNRSYTLPVLLVMLALLASLALLHTDTVRGSSPAPNSDNDPAARPEVVIPEMYRVASPGSTEAASGTAATVWFTPEDTNDTTTVIFLFNPTAQAATVDMIGYGRTGAQTISTSVNVPARQLVRIVSDSVASADLPPSWQSPVLWNYTDSAVYAKLTLPVTVHLQAYVAWAGNSGTYDPNNTGPKVPLRFSSDPATVLLPVVTR